MNPYHGRASARPEEPITPAILRGAAWKARRIRSNCLRQHCHAVATMFRRREFDSLRPICARIFHVLETRSRILAEIHPKDLPVVAAVARLAAYGTSRMESPVPEARLGRGIVPRLRNCAEGIHRGIAFQSCVGGIAGTEHFAESGNLFWQPRSASSWLRLPEDWHPDPASDPHSQWSSLLRHLLARYPVPAFLDAAWTRGGGLEHFDRDCWCAIAQGRSPRTVPGFPRSIPRRVLHAALNDDQSDHVHPWHSQILSRAIWRAQLRFLNASNALETAVMASRVPRELGNYALWSRLVSKFSAARDANPEAFDFTANSLTAAHTYLGPVKVGQLMKLPLNDLVRHCRRFVACLVQAQEHSPADPQVRAAMEKADLARLLHSRWSPLLKPVPITFATPKGTAAHWIVEELCSITALQEESRAMKHCVETFAGRCRAGHASIFSVRRYETKADGEVETISYATIEVRRPSMKIAQVRAYGNRPANNTMLNIVRDWAAEHNLVCDA